MRIILGFILVWLFLLISSAQVKATATAPFRSYTGTSCLPSKIGLSNTLVTWEEIARTVKNGGRYEWVTIHDHDFHFKPVSMSYSGNNTWHVSGGMSHILAHRPDDQITYECDVRILPNGGIAVSGLSMTSTNSIDAVFDLAAKGISLAYGVPANGSDASFVYSKIEQIFDGSWESACAIGINHLVRALFNS